MKLKKLVSLAFLTLSLVFTVNIAQADTDFLMGMSTGVSNGSPMGMLGATVNSMTQETTSSPSVQSHQENVEDNGTSLVLFLVGAFSLLTIVVALSGVIGSLIGLFKK